MHVCVLAWITRENGNEEIKMKQNAYVQNGRPFIARSVAVHSPFAVRGFFKRAPAVRIERGTFFEPTVVVLYRTKTFSNILQNIGMRLPKRTETKIVTYINMR